MISVAVYDAKPYDRASLEQAKDSAQVNWRFLDYRLSPDTAETARGATTACVFVNDAVNRVCLETLAQLGVHHVALRCAGHNNVDLTAARSLGITVTRVPAYSPHAVAEHAVALLLTLNRKIHRAYNRVREHNFSLTGLTGFDVRGKRVGIVGTGKIGRIAAQIFRGFEAEVVVFDRYPDQEWAAHHGIQYCDFDTLLATSDIVSLHVPLLPDTKHLLKADTIARMKRGAYVINTSRGKLIQTSALIDALKQGHLGGVALDVYEEEEGVFFEDHSDHVLHDDALIILLTLPNVLITSHQAFLTHEALAEIAQVTVENILRIGRGEPALDGTRL